MRFSSIRRSPASTAGSSSSRTSPSSSRRPCRPMSPPRSIELIRNHGLDVWVYRGNDWLVGNPDGPARRARGLDRQVRAEGREGRGRRARPGLQDRRRQRRSGQRCSAARPTPGRPSAQRATANRSQPYYLDVTNKDANKGAVVDFLSRHLGVPIAEIATIGDQPTDVPMFKRSGFSIAMGNAPDRGQGSGRPSPRIPTTTKASPRRWNASSWAHD